MPFGQGRAQCLVSLAQSSHGPELPLKKKAFAEVRPVKVDVHRRLSRMFWRTDSILGIVPLDSS